MHKTFLNGPARGIDPNLQQSFWQKRQLPPSPDWPLIEFYSKKLAESVPVFGWAI
jgi:hypothetical protein